MTYFGHCLRALGHDVSEDSVLDGDGTAIIACAHLLSADAPLPADAIVFNSEPLVGAAAWPAKDAYRALLARSYVWDYAEPNVVALPHASVIPFWFRPELVRGPRRAGRRLLFYGSLTPRRHRLLRQLTAHGVDVDVRFGVYGDERDRALADALAVLNLHKQDDVTLFEPIRCFYPLTSGVPVISEETSDPSAEPFRAAMHFVAAGSFVRDVVALVADDERLCAGAAAFERLDPLPTIAAAIERYVSYRSTSSRR